MTEDWYRVLRVDPFAEPDVIAAAYKRLARRYHPDLNASADATEMMQRLNDAYAVLGDPQKRAVYDRQRRQGPRTGRANQERGRDQERGNRTRQRAEPQAQTVRPTPEPTPAGRSSISAWWPLAVLVSIRVGMAVGEQLDPWLVARFGWEAGYGEPLGAIVVPLAVCAAIRASV